MLVALLSDIHANQSALQAVLKSAADAGAAEFWFLGDAVGYGPSPAAAVQWLRGDLAGTDAPVHWVLGNHDAMVSDLAAVAPEDAALNAPWFRVGKDQITGDELWASGAILSQSNWSGTNPKALQVIARHRADLAAGAFGAVAELFTLDRKRPVHVHKDGIDFVLVHSGHVDNLLRYIYAWQVDQFLPDEFLRLGTLGGGLGGRRVQCFGHTHVPTLVHHTVDGAGAAVIRATEVVPDKAYKFGDGLVLLNPGSVGQPRDLCTYAAYALLDTEQSTVTFRRIKYQVPRTRMLMQVEDYPEHMIERLSYAHAEPETPAGWLQHYAVVAESYCG